MKVAYLSGMNISASGLAAQREAMNAAAENLANAQTTRTASGDPYRRKMVPLAADPRSFDVENRSAAARLPLDRTNPDHIQPSPRPTSSRATLAGVRASVAEDMSEFPMVYDPGHPDADEDGMVRMPNVDVAHEMVTLMVASRAYEANIAALQAARKVAEAGLNMAR